MLLRRRDLGASVILLGLPGLALTRSTGDPLQVETAAAAIKAGTIVVAATSLIGQIILIEASTEFFGFGVASLIRPTLGNLIAEAASSGIGSYSFLNHGWWVWTAPAALLVILWLLGFLAFHVAGGLIHILLVVAVIVLVLHFVRGRV